MLTVCSLLYIWMLSYHFLIMFCITEAGLVRQDQLINGHIDTVQCLITHMLSPLPICSDIIDRITSEPKHSKPEVNPFVHENLGRVVVSMSQ